MRPLDDQRVKTTIAPHEPMSFGSNSTGTSAPPPPFFALKSVPAAEIVTR
jgi:hypothetical protein